MTPKTVQEALDRFNAEIREWAEREVVGQPVTEDIGARVMRTMPKVVLFLGVPHTVRITDVQLTGHEINLSFSLDPPSQMMFPDFADPNAPWD